MKRVFHTWATVAGSILLAFPAYGEEPEAELPPYTVRAPRVERAAEALPYSVSRVDQFTIQSGTLQLSLAEPLDNVPGVFVLNPYNFAQDTRIAIRGFGARSDFGIRGIRLYVDGIPATTPDGQGEVDGLDLGSAERIELLRGPASALYGSAAGGVLLVETERPPDTPFAETRLTAGSYGLLQFQAKAGARTPEGGILLSGSHLLYDGYRSHSRTRGARLNIRGEQLLGPDTLLTLTVNAIDLPVQDDPGGLTREEARAHPRQARDRNRQFDAGERVTQQRLGLRVQHALAPDREVELRAWTVHRDFANKLPFENGGQVTFQRHAPGAGLVFREEEGALRYRAGVEVETQDDHRTNYDNLQGQRGDRALDQRESVWSLGAFIAPERDLTDRLTVSAALRYDRVVFDVDDAFRVDGDDSGRLPFDAFSPMAGFVVAMHPALNLFANVSRSFETPTTTELDRPDGGGFNDSLAPQTAIGSELGAKGSWAAGAVPLRYDVAVFHLDIEESLVPFEREDTPGREFYRNAGSSSRVGLEAFLEAQPLPSLTLSGSYTWSDFDYDRFNTSSGDFSGNTLPGIPTHVGALVAQLRHPEGLFLRWNTRLVGSMYADDGNRTRVDGYATSDLRGGWDVQRDHWMVSPFVGVNNLFNQSYSANIRINAFGGRYYEPAPGRNLFGGLRVRYQFY